MTATLMERSSGSLADQAYHQLRDQLVLLDIPPGAPIIEGRLSAQLGIGRTPIREGLKKLESDRLVVSYPRRGTFATQVDITDLADISELRQVLEPLAARRSASRARPEVRAALASTADRIASMGPEPADRRPAAQGVRGHRPGSGTKRTRSSPSDSPAPDTVQRRSADGSGTIRRNGPAATISSSPRRTSSRSPRSAIPPSPSTPPPPARSSATCPTAA